MADWMKLVGGGFAHMDAPFAVHPLDEQRAREYREEADAAGLDWSDVQTHVIAYADKKGWSSEKRAEELTRVRQFMGM